MTKPFASVVHSNVLIVGAGVAGLSAALELENCTVLTKCQFGSGGSTGWAQGGVAAAMDPNDSPESHALDTLKAAAGIADPEVVRELTGSAPETIRDLIELGGHFDETSDGRLALSREGGHTTRRIVHAEGDATGREVLRTLSEATETKSGIRIVENFHAVDLAMSQGRVVGIVGITEDGSWSLHLASEVILATGGACCAFARTTNPKESTGDGIAMAIRAGAEIADMEFVQFHPTALDVGHDPMPLLTEALRGEGATLVDEDGYRFMVDVHPNAELAPRDVVARAIWSVIQSGRKVFLDAKSVFRDSKASQFGVCRTEAIAAGLDPVRDLLPVSPAAHYFIGGVSVDHDGRSSLPGLWVVGEASSTGIHGANRLASNSLLEGLVLGKVAAKAIQSLNSQRRECHEIEVPSDFDTFAVGKENSTIEQIRATMWDRVGVVREESGLKLALEELASLRSTVGISLDARNLRTVGEAVATAALNRTESRGAHFRSDYPDSDPLQAHRNIWSIAAVSTKTVRTKESVA